MLNFLQQDRFLANEVVLLARFGARERDVRYRQEKPGVIGVPIVELVCVQDQLPGVVTIAGQFELIGLDLGGARRSRPQQRCELRDSPFAIPQIGNAFPGQGLRLHLEGAAERPAGRDDAEIGIQKQERLIRGGDHGQRARGFDMIRRGMRHGVALKGRRLAKRSHDSAEIVPHPEDKAPSPAH